VIRASAAGVTGLLRGYFPPGLRWPTTGTRPRIWTLCDGGLRPGADGGRRRSERNESSTWRPARGKGSRSRSTAVRLHRQSLRRQAKRTRIPAAACDEVACSLENGSLIELERATFARSRAFSTSANARSSSSTMASTGRPSRCARSAAHFGVSAERVRQIEEHALDGLREALLAVDTGRRPEGASRS
jgi:hypothetical protein